MSVFVFLELEGLGLGLELGLGVGLGASKLLIADCRYATHGNRVPVAGMVYRIHDLKYRPLANAQLIYMNKFLCILDSTLTLTLGLNTDSPRNN